MGFNIKNILNAETAGQIGQMDEIDDMAAGIEMAGGLQEPLVLGG